MKIATADPERLAQAMRDTGMNVWKLSQATGIPRGRLSFYRNGSQPCTGSNIARLAHALGVPIGSLL